MTGKFKYNENTPFAIFWVIVHVMVAAVVYWGQTSFWSEREPTFNTYLSTGLIVIIGGLAALIIQFYGVKWWVLLAAIELFIAWWLPSYIQFYY